jgi:hypothetical protein
MANFLYHFAAGPQVYGEQVIGGMGLECLEYWGWTRSAVWMTPSVAAMHG